MRRKILLVILVLTITILNLILFKEFYNNKIQKNNNVYNINIEK